MADDVDRVQERQLEEVAHANRIRPQRVGRTRCAECNEAISLARQALGADLCIEHQREREARDAHVATWKRR